MKFIFSGLNNSIIDVFKRTDLYDRVGEDHFFRNATLAINMIHSKAHKYSKEEHCPLVTLEKKEKMQERL